MTLNSGSAEPKQKILKRARAPSQLAPSAIAYEGRFGYTQILIEVVSNNALLLLIDTLLFKAVAFVEAIALPSIALIRAFGQSAVVCSHQDPPKGS